MNFRNFLILVTLVSYNIFSAPAISKTTPKLLISSPGESSVKSEINDGWFSVIADEYFRFKFESIFEFNTIEKKLNIKDGSASSTYGLVPTDENIFSAVKNQSASHFIIHSYTVNSADKNISYYLELYSANPNSVLYTFDETFSFDSISTVLDKCAKDIATAMKITLSGNSQQLLDKSILSNDLDLLISYGKLKASNSLSIEALKNITQKDNSFVLAQMSLGKAYEKNEEYAYAAASYNSAIIRNSIYSARTFIPAIRNFRLSKKIGRADKLFATATLNGIKSIKLDVEKALIYQSTNKNKMAQILFAKILKQYPTEPNALLNRSILKRDAKNYTEALKILNSLIDKEQLLPQAHYEKAACLNAKKLTDAALKEVELAIKLNPKNSAAIILAANLYYIKKMYKPSAKLYYLEFIKNRPDIKDLLQAASAIKKSGDKKKSLKLLNKYRSSYGADNTFLMTTGFLEFELGDTAKARFDLELCKGMTPTNGKIFKVLGDIYYNTGNSPKAIARYEKARPLVKNKNKIDFNLARLYIKKNLFTKAKTKLTQVLAKKPKYKTANRYLGDVNYALKKSKSALVYYKKERTLYGADKYLQYQIATINLELKQYTNAKIEWKKYIDISPKEQKSYINLFEISIALSKPTEADSYLMQAEAFGKIDKKLIIKLAKLQTKKKLYKNSIKSYSKYIKLAPRDFVAIKALAKVYTNAGMDSLTAITYQKLYALDNSTHNSYLAKAGHIFYKLKKINKAKVIYNKFLLRGYKDNKVNINLAQIEYDEKNYKRATNLLSKVPAKENISKKLTEILALSYYKQAKYSQAIPYLKKHHLSKPTDVNIIKITAVTYDTLKNYPAAIEMYKKFLATPKGKLHKNYAYHLTELYLKANLKSQAVKQYNANIISYPKDIRNYQKLYKSYLAKKQKDLAISTLENAIQNSTPDKIMKRKLADLYYGKKQFSKTIVALKIYLKDAPKDSERWIRLGSLLFNAKRYEEAIEPLKTANAQKPKNIKVISTIGESFFKIGNTREATTYLEAYMSYDSTNINIISFLSKTYTALKDTANLITILQKESKYKPTDFSLQMRIAKLLENKGDYKGAVLAYERATKANKKDLLARKKTIKYYTKFKKAKKCLYHLNEGIKYHPQNGDFYFEKAKILSIMKRDTEAISDFKKAIYFNKKNYLAYYFLGKIYRKSGKYSLAYENFKKAAKLKTKNTKYLFHLAEAAYYIGKLAEGDKYVTKIITIEPKNIEFLILAGNIFMKEKKYAKAEAVYEKAVAINYDCGLCHLVLGKINYNNKKYFKAVKHFKAPSALSSADGILYMMLAKSLNALNRKSDARPFFIKAMESEPDNNEAYYLAISAYIETGEFDKAMRLGVTNLNRPEDIWSLLAKGKYYEIAGSNINAIKAYKRVLNYDKINADAQTGIGRVYLKMNKFNEALELFGRAMVKRPDDPEIYALMAEAYFDLNNTEAAVELAKEVLKSDPTQVGANRIIGIVYVEQKQHSIAIDALERATRIDNVNCDLNLPLGKEYLISMQYENAIGALLKAVECDKSNAKEIYKMLGDICYFKLHNKKNAKKYYQEYLNSGGDNPKIKTVVQQL